MVKQRSKLIANNSHLLLNNYHQILTSAGQSNRINLQTPLEEKKPINFVFWSASVSIAVSKPKWKHLKLWSDRKKILTMKGFLIFALFLLAQHIKAATINCEKTPLLFNERLGRIRSCFLADVTAIDSPGFEIAERNEQIYALYFESNTKIHFCRWRFMKSSRICCSSQVAAVRSRKYQNPILKKWPNWNFCI